MPTHSQNRHPWLLAILPLLFALAACGAGSSPSPAPKGSADPTAAPLSTHTPSPTPVATPAAVSPSPSVPSPTQKIINLDLTTQSATFIQNGRQVGSTLITTGRRGLRTPTGTFYVFGKVSPINFISPWPKGSPYYYPPETAQFALRFAAGGYFIHDAPFEPLSAYGPGSQNGPSASHGCVHIPFRVMTWLYKWATLGTEVLIHY